MTVLDYVMQNEIQEFYCKTITEIILVHTHKSRAGRETKVYVSFKSFADKEIVKIEKDFRNIPIFYVKFNDTDWQKEIKNIFIEDKRDFSYYIKSERPLTRY